MSDRLDAELEARTREARNDPRSTHELISLALAEVDDDAAWEPVRVLHFRGTRDVFDAASRLCDSECPQERRLGADILAQLGVPRQTFPEESAAVLLGMLRSESDELVLQSICSALGYIGDPAAVPALSRLKTHNSAVVRHSVASALGGYSEPLAIATLIELSRDPDDLVRDWSTFGLGTQIDEDTPEIRAALFARVSDKDETTRGEAMLGLARRRDQRVVEPLARELARYPEAQPACCIIEAAEETAHPRLLPVLESLKRSTGSAKYDEAIRLCSGTT